MANVTLAMDDELITSARAFAKSEGTTLNALLRKLVADAIEQKTRREEARHSLLEMMEKSTARLPKGYKFNREELYESQAFLDTNVLVYAAAGRLSDPAEYAVAKAIVDQEDFFVSPLVLGEFYSAVRKPQKELMPALQARLWIEKWMAFCPLDIDSNIIGTAAFYRERYKIQLWDAAHIATAERLGLQVLLSQDMNHKQKYGSVTVINPFRSGLA